MSAEHDAIAGLVQEFEPGALVTKFVVVAEVIDANGQCAVWTAVHEGAKSWDTYGLLTYAMSIEDQVDE